jgi:hypothetical protein
MSLYSACITPAFAQGTAFTYQGRLNSGGGPANGTYDFRFRLASDPLANNYIGSAYLTNSIAVTGGLFSATPDFGPGIFTGSNYWLEVSVRTNGGGAYTALNPLQPLTPTPYAIFANNSSNLLGTLSAGQLNGPIANGNLPASASFSGTVTANSFTGNGVNVSNVNALALNGLSSSNFWQLGGNKVGAGQFLGSTNSQPLELWVNGQRGWRLEPNDPTNAAVNIVGGSAINFVAAGVVAATISGGGSSNYFGAPYTNSVTADFGTIGGGGANIVSNTVATVGGGLQNIAGGNAATVAGGQVNNATGGESTVGGGQFNTASGDTSTVAAGAFNNATGNRSFVGAGVGNSATNSYGIVAGGGNNLAGGQFSIVVGGWANTNSGDFSAIGGGYGNSVQMNATVATIAGGYDNATLGYGSTISGGQNNHATNGANYETIGGGYGNTVTGFAGTVPGGRENVAGWYAFAGGFDAQATNSGSFVWADFSGFEVPFGSLVNNSFSVRAMGGARFVTGGAGVTVDGFPLLASGGGSGITIQNNGNGAPNVIEGGAYNFATPGVIGATIAGGGATNFNGGAYTNRVLGYFGTVGGGIQNIAANYTVVAGGSGNISTGDYSVISGGWLNTNDYVYSVIGGGAANYIHNAGVSFIGGGNQNQILAPLLNNEFDAIAGGLFNVESNVACSFIGGGIANTDYTSFSVIAGGATNTLNQLSRYSFIGAGENNTVLSNSDHSVIVGGLYNLLGTNAPLSTIAGGMSNTISANTANGTIGGGGLNTVGGTNGTVPGGRNNSAAGNYSFAAGQQAQALHQGAFVWADSQNASFASTANDQFNVRAQGGARFVTGGAGLSVDGSPVLTSGGNSGIVIQQNSSGGPNIIEGSSANSISAGVIGATISGGGATNPGTYGNTVTANFATVGGGQDNNANGDTSTIGGGFNNTTAGSSYATIAGGSGNLSDAYSSTVGGGRGNHAGADFGTVGGGYNVYALGYAATAAGGMGIYASGAGSTVGGGGTDGSTEIGNAAWGTLATIGGGWGNSAGANSYVATIGGGQHNTNNGYIGTIAGGQNNYITQPNGLVYQPAIGGGYGNMASNSYATIPGGILNIAGGEYSFAAGQQAQAFHQGAFVWADSQNSTFSSTANDQFLIRAKGGVGINKGNPGGALEVNGNVYLIDTNTADSHAVSISGNQTAGTFQTASLNVTNLGNSPALRVVANGSTTPAGALSVSVQNLTGPIALFGNSGAFVTTINNDGSITAPTFNGALNGSVSGSIQVSAAASLRLNDRPIYFRTGSDTNHGLAYNGQTTTNFGTGNVQVDGPVLWGFTGGALGIMNGGAHAVLNWSNGVVAVTGNVYANGVQLTSDRNAKEHFTALNPQSVLAKVAAMPITEWNYKSENADDKHIGPMAQDFHEAFGLNGNDDKHISAVDGTGVALSAIQGLNQEVEDLKTENAELKQRLATLEKIIKSRK